MNNSFFSGISYLEIMESIQAARQITNDDDSTSDNDDILRRETSREGSDALKSLTKLSIKETFSLNPSLVQSLNDPPTDMNNISSEERVTEENTQPKYNVGLSNLQDVGLSNSSSNWSLVQKKPPLTNANKTSNSPQPFNQPVSNMNAIVKSVTYDKSDNGPSQSNQNAPITSNSSNLTTTTIAEATMEAQQLSPNLHNTSAPMNNPIGYVRHQQTTTFFGNQQIGIQPTTNTNLQQWLPSVSPAYHLPIIPTANAFQPTAHYYHPMMRPATSLICPNRPGYPSMMMFHNTIHQQQQQQQRLTPGNCHIIQQQQQQQQPFFIRPSFYMNQGSSFIHVNSINEQPLIQQPPIQQPPIQQPPMQSELIQPQPQQLIYIPSFSISTLRHKIQFLHDYCIHVLETSNSVQSLKDYIKRSTINAFQEVDDCYELPYTVSAKIVHGIELKIEANYTLVHNELTEFSGFILDTAAHIFSHRLDKIEMKLTSLEAPFSKGVKMEDETSEKKACLQFMLKLCSHEAEICRKLQKERDSHAIFLEVKVSFLESKLSELHQLFVKNNLLIPDSAGGNERREGTPFTTPLMVSCVNKEDYEVDSWLAQREDDPHVKEYQAEYDRRMAQRLPSPTP